MQRICSTILCLSVLFLAATAVAAEPLVLDVWPGKTPPGDATVLGPEKYLEENPGERKVARLTNVTQPTIAVYQAPAEKATGAAVVICPGGGYHILAMDLEGTEVAEWLNSIGVTAVVLKYRVPKRPNQPQHQAPLQDAQRAMSLVRSMASEWKLDPKKIGILGFSAGGNLAALTSMHYESRAYDKLDDVDETSCRPDFAILVYPAYLVNKEGTELAPEVKITSQTPPMFFAHAADARLLAESSVLTYLELNRAGVEGSELHLYARGGHGFGLPPSTDPVSTWPKRCEEWLKTRGIVK